MNEKDVLEELGLSEAETKVYLALLDAGETLVGPIIKASGLHRGTTYQILQRLKEKGLASSVIKGKKQHFVAADPARLMDALREKERYLEEILPSLNAKIRSSKEKQEVTVYSGARGIRSALEKQLEELTPGGTYYDFGVSGLLAEVMGNSWYVNTWGMKKKENGIKSYVIFDERVRQKKTDAYLGYVGKARYHPKQYTSLTDTMIYRDTVILLIWTAKPPLAVVIKNRDNAQSYKNQFKLMWKMAKK